jgi:hypothetical protein
MSLGVSTISVSLQQALQLRQSGLALQSVGVGSTRRTAAALSFLK